MVELAERDWDGYLRVPTPHAGGAPASLQMTPAAPGPDVSHRTSPRPLR
jgi:hypothetical protein